MENFAKKCAEVGSLTNQALKSEQKDPELRLFKDRLIGIANQIKVAIKIDDEEQIQKLLQQEMKEEDAFKNHLAKKNSLCRAQ